MASPAAAGPRPEPRAGRRAAAIAIALVAPNLVWIALDRSPFGGDAAQYATATMELFAKLLASPGDWPRAMLAVMPYKAPGLEWFGQLFLPLAFPLGEVGRPLLLAIAAAGIAGLALLWAALAELSRSRGAALAGSLTVAGAPLFVTYGNVLMVEMLQIVAAAWFVAIAAFAPRWPRALVLAQLAAAAAFAALAKTTTLVFVVFPALVALASAVRRGEPWSRGLRDRATRLALAAAILLGAAALLFYLRNWPSLFNYFRAGAGSSVWGKVDTPLATAAYWLAAIGRHAITPWGLSGLAALALFACAPRLARRTATSPHFRRCALAAAAQMVTMIALFSLSSNRMPRFMAPILPLFAVVVAWAVASLGSRIARGAAIAALSAQFVVVHASSFGMVEAYRDAIRPLDRAGTRSGLLTAIVDATCDGSGRAPVTIIAIDAAFRGDWLAPASATYLATERRFLGKTAADCRYDYLGRRFFGLKSGSWESLTKSDVGFVVATDPAIHPPLAKTFNFGLNPERYPEVWERLSTSELFARVGPVGGEPGIVLFRRRS